MTQFTKQVVGHKMPLLEAIMILREVSCIVPQIKYVLSV
jgi:hypothetical protein